LNVSDVASEVASEVTSEVTSEVDSEKSIDKLTAESSKHQCECIFSIFKTSSSAVSFMRR